MFVGAVYCAGADELTGGVEIFRSSTFERVPAGRTAVEEFEIPVAVGGGDGGGGGGDGGDKEGEGEGGEAHFWFG